MRRGRDPASFPNLRRGPHSDMLSEGRSDMKRLAFSAVLLAALAAPARVRFEAGMKCLALVMALIIGLTTPAWAELDRKTSYWFKQLVQLCASAHGLASIIDTPTRPFLKSKFFNIVKDKGASNDQLGLMLGAFNVFSQGWLGGAKDVENLETKEIASLRRTAEAVGPRCEGALEWSKDWSKSVPSGDAGIKPFLFRAFKRWAELGSVVSAYDLGIMYAEGGGVPQNDVLAQMWLSIAAAQGHVANPGQEDARNYRDNVAKRMTSDKIAEAQKLAREWLAKHGQ